MQKQVKIKWVIIISAAVVMILGLLGFIYIRYNQQKVLFLKIDKLAVDIGGSRFIMDGVKVGTLKLENRTQNNQWVYRVKLEQRVHIPKSSRISITTDDQSRIIVNVELLASENYYQKGDTISGLHFDGSLPSGIMQIEAADAKEPKMDERKAEEQNKTVEFRVQLLASKHEIANMNTRFKGMDGLNVAKENGLFKYYLGPFSGIDKAREARKLAMEKGVDDAFIVAYRDSVRISMEDALK